MTDSSNQNNPPPSEVRPPLSRHEERQLRREERRAARGEHRGGGWIIGAVLVVAGLALLAQNFGFPMLTNWWALFILIPAVGALANAWRAYQAAGGRLTGYARGSLIGGLVLLMVTAVLLFNLNWGLLGPILIIIVGVGLLINTFLPN